MANGEKDDWPLDSAELMSGSDEPGNADAAAVGDPNPPPENAEPSPDAEDAGDPMPPPDNADPSDPGRPDATPAGDPMPLLEDPEEPPVGVPPGLNGTATPPGRPVAKVSPVWSTAPSPPTFPGRPLAKVSPV
ncbi:hypothetical protein [Mycolicibacter arupensis]|uniref:hypothetical protein n=1 Tax=Mycolicibacter arupensis TaxID=342002 RepID=UPI00122D2361|nr:hypothetical protein [Mycolicibacter arupensis]KAA1429578.1 hypothetical protein F0402_18620 [Mycolicibacter arupensis]